MIYQKLIYHIILFEEDYRSLFWAETTFQDDLGVELVWPDWRRELDDQCKKVGLRVRNAAIQHDHVHLLVDHVTHCALNHSLDHLAAWFHSRQPGFDQSLVMGRMSPINVLNSHSTRGKRSLSSAVFSVSHSLVDQVGRFIDQQTKHHLTVDLDEELTALLDKHDAGATWTPKGQLSGPFRSQTCC